jgi:hypothetical protein
MTRDSRHQRTTKRFAEAKLRRNYRLLFGAVGAGFWLGWVEAVADPGFGVDVARMAGVGLDFPPQLIDKNAQVFGFFPVVGSPDGLQEAAVRLRLAGIRNELAQEFKFLGR